MGDKVRQSTTDFRYQGNLSNDAKRLGMNTFELNKILNIKGGITTIARELFKAIIPEDRRNVLSWNQLGQDVLVKEKLLIGLLHDTFSHYSRSKHTLSFLLDFMKRYYGPLEADERKIHVSLVGCLRNRRHTEKRQGQASLINNHDHESDDHEDLPTPDDFGCA